MRMYILLFAAKLNFCYKSSKGYKIAVFDEARGHIFYCDPQQPDQKPHVENNHNLVRNILPNKTKLDKLTQT